MKYPNVARLAKLADEVKLYTQLKTEYRSPGVAAVVAKAERALRSAVRDLARLPADPALARREPNDLAAIRALRPRGPRRIWSGFDRPRYLDRLEGALLARCAGCTLGAPVEGWPIDKMKALAEETGQPFPPRDYWTYVPEPARRRYGTSPIAAYTRSGMDGVPVDDDTAYTLLGLLIAEDYGPGFTTANVGRAWLKYLPVACTAEKVALENLRRGVPADRAGRRGNPYCEWIGADIRADPWGYLAPGWPERAAQLAFRDAWISHRRQGIYGAMYFAAVIAAAFAVDDPVQALRFGLSEIPRDCGLAKAVRWALRIAPDIRDYRQARAAVDARFAGMHPVHTINNACLTVWSLTIGGRDVTRVIGEAVAMGLDNDCTAATAGSIVGATVGRRGVPSRWHRRFHDTLHSYLTGRKRFSISGVVRRFARQAERVWAACPAVPHRPGRA